MWAELNKQRMDNIYKQVIGRCARRSQRHPVHVHIPLPAQEESLERRLILHYLDAFCKRLPGEQVAQSMQFGKVSHDRETVRDAEDVFLRKNLH